MPVSGGPHVQIAGFCEKVIEEKDGVLTLVRMIDRVTVARQRGSESSSLPFVFLATLVLCLKSGFMRGTKQLSIERETPSGSVDFGPTILSVLFEGEGDRGVNVVTPMAVPYPDEGIYWWNVKLEGELLTRIPFRVVWAYTQ